MERAIPILPTNDLAAAKAFYVDGLGFRVTFEASADGRTGLLGLQRGTIELTLDCPMDGHGRNACVSLHVTDADAYYREWSAKVTPLHGLPAKPFAFPPWLRDFWRTGPTRGTLQAFAE